MTILDWTLVTATVSAAAYFAWRARHPCRHNWLECRVCEWCEGTEWESRLFASACMNPLISGSPAEWAEFCAECGHRQDKCGQPARRCAQCGKVEITQ